MTSYGSFLCPEEQVESKPGNEKMSAPEKDDFESETIELRRSPRELQNTSGHSNVTKDKRHDEFPFSKENGSSCLANVKSNGKVDSSPKEVSEDVFHDFTRERSMEKFQTDQIWAMYKDGLPNRYVQIKYIKRCMWIGAIGHSIN
ncbi:hypothetical protein LguiA_010909 [Lonicera macranthoides]